MSNAWMRPCSSAGLALVVSVTLASCANQQTATQEPPASAPTEKPHWDYGTEKGPASWGSLSPEYVACAEGASQSPIDIPSAAAAAAATAASIEATYGSVALSIDHHEHVTDVIDNGHTIQVNCEGAGSITVGDRRYGLAQYHFHSPSEHTVDGASFPMEMHMVHKSDDGKLAVVGTLIAEGAANPAFEAVWANLPTQHGQEIHLPDVVVDVDRLLPKDRTAFHYDGSLTTPPCSEGVAWMMMKTPIQLSAEQIAKFRAVINGNNRPTQALNGRTVGMDRVVQATTP